MNKYKFITGNIKKYEIIGNSIIIHTGNESICIKKQKRMDVLNIHSYLRSKNYNNILDIKVIDGMEITPYIKDINTIEEDRLTEGIYLITLLHNKTTFYKKLSLDNVKEVYESITDHILYIKNYYESICYNVDSDIILSPSNYLFIRNISIILNSLNKSKYYLDKWYEISKEKLSKRCVLNHNNLNTSHILIGNIPYLINFNNYVYDSPIIDLAYIIRNNYKVLDITSSYNIYISKYPLMREEVYFLFSKILIPDIIKFNDKEIVNTKNIYELYNYLNIVNLFILKNDLKDKKK